MNTLASSINTVIRGREQSLQEFTADMVNSCDVILVLDDAVSNQVQTFAPAATPVLFDNSIKMNEAIHKASPTSIGLIFSNWQNAPIVNCHNMESIAAESDTQQIEFFSNKYAEMLSKHPKLAHAEFHVLMHDIHDIAASIAAVMNTLPTTLHIPHYYVKTFEWERPKDISWSVPRAISKRVLSLLKSQDAHAVTQTQSVVAASTSAAAPAPVAAPTPPEPAKPALSLPHAKAPPTKASLSNLADIRDKIQTVAPDKSAIKIRDMLAIHRDNPLHDAWESPINIDGQIYKSVTHYLAYAKVKFFGETVEDGFFQDASVLQCLRLLLPDDKHNVESQRNWGRVRLEAFKKATIAKINQIKEAAAALKETGITPLIYLSRDRKLGVGFDDPNEDPRLLCERVNWRGGNGAGLFLQELQMAPGGDYQKVAEITPQPSRPFLAKPATTIVRKMVGVVAHQLPHRASDDDEDDLTEEDLARLSGKIPVRLSRYQE